MSQLDKVNSELSTRDQADRIPEPFLPSSWRCLICLGMSSKSYRNAKIPDF